MNTGRQHERLAAWFMVIPALAGLAVFVALPLFVALGFSFTNMRMGSPLPLVFKGLEQYGRILADEAFQRAFINNTIFALVVVPLQTSLALFLALLLNQKLKGSAFFRTLFFMPVVFPMSLVSVVWALIYIPDPAGLMNTFLYGLSFGSWQARDFLHDPLLALPAIILLSIWQGCGFQMVIILAGLQAVPEQLYEAASIDGAGRGQQFLNVTLPQIRNTLIFVALITTVLSFRLFDQVQILTRGGPGNATTTVMYEMVQTVFERQQIGRASAITVVFFLIVLLITLAQNRLVKQKREIK